MPLSLATYRTLYYHYGRSYLALTGGCTLIVAYFLYRYGVSPIVLLLRFKLLTTLLFAYAHYQRQRRYRTFYYNFGLSPWQLLIAVIVLDLTLFVVSTYALLC